MRLPVDALRSHQVLVGRTGTGKSTTQLHICAGIMRRIAAWRRDDGPRPRVVAIDPHTDNALAVLRSVPLELAARAAYLDWSRDGHMPVCNLLDAHLFGSDIDLHVDRLVAMLRLHWPDMWGPRMESVLRYALLFLYAENQRIDRDRQHTIVDVLKFVSDRPWRDDLLRRSRDPRLVEMFRQTYDNMARPMWGQAVHPVENKIQRFGSSFVTRHVFDQPASSIDIARLIEAKDIVVINTAAHDVGRDTAGFISATIINLLGDVVRDQARLPPEQRRPLYLALDEAASMAAVDYVTFFSELRKYGLRCVLTTQSFELLGQHLAAVILANTDVVIAFRCSSADAARLEAEFGGVATRDDILALDDYQFYLRAPRGGRMHHAVSVRGLPPPAATAERTELARRIRDDSRARYGRPVETDQ